MKIKTFILICALVGSASSFEDYDYFDENVDNGFENNFNDYIVNIALFSDDSEARLLAENEDLKKLHEETANLEIAAAKALIDADEKSIAAKKARSEYNALREKILKAKVYPKNNADEKEKKPEL